MTYRSYFDNNRWMLLDMLRCFPKRAPRVDAVDDVSKIESLMSHTLELGIPQRSDGLPSGSVSPRPKTVASAIGQLLAEFGVRRCFGIVGSNNFIVTHALVEAGVEYVAARHEANAVTMADVYARLTGQLVVATLHAGPGLTNGLTGIGEAAKSRTPLLVLAGDVALGAVHSNFAFEQADAVRAVGAISERIHTPETALQDVKRAIDRAVRDRRTVVLTLPLDVQEAPISDQTLRPALEAVYPRIYPDPASIASLVEVIDRSRKPLILAGRGAVVANAKSQLLALGEQVGALFATTICAHGMFNESRWSLGICGGFASAAAAEIIRDSDLILVFGAGLSRWTTKNGRIFSSSATLAQIDCDASRIGLQHPVHVHAVGDVAATAELVLSEIGRRRIRAGKGWRSELTRERIVESDNHRTPYEEVPSKEFLDPRTISKAIDRIIPEDRIVVTDAGHWIGWAARYLRVKDERSWCMPLSFQSIGLGLASAIGASLSSPEKLVLLAAGDGGFAMSLADFETAVRLKRRICIFLFDDSAYGAEVHHFGRLGYTTEIAKFPETDFAAVARGFGAKGVVVRQLSDLEPVVEWVKDGALGVFVVDAKINPMLEADWHRQAHGG